MYFINYEMPHYDLIELIYQWQNVKHSEKCLDISNSDSTKLKLKSNKCRYIRFSTFSIKISVLVLIMVMVFESN